jgi:hypothetical protein
MVISIPSLRSVGAAFSPLSQAATWLCAFSWYSLPGAWHLPTLVQCRARAGARVSYTPYSWETVSARIFIFACQTKEG